VTRGRLEAFTDAVIAIVMTIMVLDLRPPAGQGFSNLGSLVPKFLVYALSFTFLAIYWNNHHHLMHVVERIDGRVLWANMGLLFALSLTPAATAWLGEHPRHTAPVVVYGLVLLLSAFAYSLLTRALLALHPPEVLERLALLFGVVGQDHPADDRQAVLPEEHVLGPAQADSGRPQAAGVRGVLTVVGVGAHP